ncbi:MAG: ferritin [Desulfuromonas sp.]|nr:MAG: ferritin [Desulfuromonas sp.]
MSDTGNACFTLDAALEQAVEMENRIYREFLSAIRKVMNKGAIAILRDAAIGKLESKHLLEKALLEGDIESTELHEPVPTMQLDSHYGKESLSYDADSRAALAYAIHLVTGSVNYYREMAGACAGAPMSPVFAKISGDQTTLLQRLEDAYEEHFLTEN